MSGRRYRLCVAYDGRPFQGWQSQPSGNTVQDVLESALGKLYSGTAVRVSASGRTDTGVHALGQVVHYDEPEGLKVPAESIVRALNAHLPPSIRVMQALNVSPKFHARFGAVGKIYQYRIWLGAVLPPLDYQLAWHFPRSIDPGLLDEACRLIEGTHDYRNFAANRGNETVETDYVRTLWSVQAVKNFPQLSLVFHGDGFLYKMVRLLTGAVMRVASGGASPSWLKELLEAGSGTSKCSFTAPAAGLCLMQVDYPGPEKEEGFSE